MGKALFDTRAAEYELWYQTPEGRYADALEKELFLRLMQPKSGQSLLDIGCGTGHNLAFFKELGLKVTGIDVSKPMLDVASRKLGIGVELHRGYAEELPFNNDSFDVIISLDSLYHKWIKDDVKTLEELCRILSRDGRLILNLPAYNFLKSRHDKAVHTKQRYTLGDLKQKLKKAGFEVERITYRNTILLIFPAIKRIMEKVFSLNTGNEDSDLKSLPFVVNKLFTGILYLENKMIMAGFNAYFGLSIFCVASKK